MGRDWVTRHSAIRDVVVSDRQTSRAGTFALHRSCRIRTCDLQMRTWGWSPLSVLGLWFHEAKQRTLRVTSPFSHRAESFLFTCCSPTGAFQLGVCVPTKEFDLLDDLDLWRSTVSRVRHLDINVVLIHVLVSVPTHFTQNASLQNASVFKR